MKDLMPAMRSVEINSPDAISTLATKLFIDCFLFISWITEGTDYRTIVSGRYHFLVVAAVLLDSRPLSTRKRRFRNYYAVDATKEIPFMIGIVLDTPTHTHGTHACIYIFMRSHHGLHSDGMHSYACARIGARLSRDISRGGFAWYPSSTSNLFVCIGMSLCRLIHARRSCRVRHVGCSVASTRSCECTCIFYWWYHADFWSRKRALHTMRFMIPYSRISIPPSRFDLIDIIQYYLI